MSIHDNIDPTLQRLVAAHPLLFRGRAPEVPSYLMPGWYGLVDELCSKLENILVPATPKFKVRQIKEKFGILRFAWSLESVPGRDELGERIMDAVLASEAASERICENCGAPAKPRSLDGYRTTWCDEHFAEAAAKRAEPAP